MGHHKTTICRKPYNVNVPERRSIWTSKNVQVNNPHKQKEKSTTCNMQVPKQKKKVNRRITATNYELVKSERQQAGTTQIGAISKAQK